MSDRRPLSILICALLFTLFTAACGTTTSSNPPTPTSPPSITLKVFAASSLTDSFNALKTEYHNSHPDVTIQYNFSGSQTLVQQLINGASGDVFASADEANMQKAQNAGLVTSGQDFAKNKLVVIIPFNNPAGINSLHDLDKKGVKLIVGTSSVPVGKYTSEALDNLGKASTYGSSYEEAMKANEVSQEDTDKAIVQKIDLGEADAGIVYQTDITSSDASKIKSITIPDQYNVTASYPIAALKASPHSQDAAAFVQFVLSHTGQGILQQYHFIPVNP